MCCCFWGERSCVVFSASFCSSACFCPSMSWLSTWVSSGFCTLLLAWRFQVGHVLTRRVPRHGSYYLTTLHTCEFFIADVSAVSYHAKDDPEQHSTDTDTDSSTDTDCNGCLHGRTGQLLLRYMGRCKNVEASTMDASEVHCPLAHELFPWVEPLQNDSKFPRCIRGNCCLLVHFLGCCRRDGLWLVSWKELNV